MKLLLQRLTEPILSNKGLKVLSILIAIICWYSIQEVMNFDKQYGKPPRNQILNSAEQCFTRILPVKTLTSSKQRFNLRIIPETVLVSFESVNAGQSPPAPLSALIDCYNINTPGKYRLPVRCISLPDTKIVKISPSHVIVHAYSVKQNDNKLNPNMNREN
jgi:hypothetical protein